MFLGTKIELLSVQWRMAAKCLAEAVGVSPSMSSKIGNNAADPSYAPLRNLPTAVNTPLMSLVGRPQESMEPQQGGHREGQTVLVRPAERKVLHLLKLGPTYKKHRKTEKGKRVWPR